MVSHSYRSQSETRVPNLDRNPCSTEIPAPHRRCLNHKATPLEPENPLSRVHRASLVAMPRRFVQAGSAPIPIDRLPIYCLTIYRLP
jgi:hypothetical protein